ncbi:IS200/IS605 family transposase [Candidatus Woesearchaeota archaeon]|nr:IS200/IS605 family transposase [Candidatus Woesearchaeota archaeon]
MSRSIIWFSEIKEEDFSLVGARALSTAVIYNKGLPVPLGFVVTTNAFHRFLDNSNVIMKISDLLKDIDVNDKDNLDLISRNIRDIILDAEFPITLKNSILESYDNLNIDRAVSSVVGSDIISSFIKAGRELPFVSIRESSVFDFNDEYFLDRAEESYFNVKGKEDVVSYIKKCWSSFFSKDFVNYLIKNNIDFSKFSVAIIVQKMVDCEKSGFIYTGNGSDINIKAVLGLSSVIESGKNFYDTYVLDKESLEIKDKEIRKQEYGIFRDRYTGRNINNNFSDYGAHQQKITDDEIFRLAEISKVLDDYYKSPVEIEWGIDGARIYLLQARPIVEVYEENLSDSNSVDFTEEDLSDGISSEVKSEFIENEVTFQDKVDIDLGCDINYHLVLNLQCKGKNIFNKISVDFFKKVLNGVEERFGLKFYYLGFKLDELHIVLGSDPKYSPVKIVDLIKDITTRKIFEDYSDIKDFLWGGDFWSQEYCVFSLSNVSELDLEGLELTKF